MRKKTKYLIRKRAIGDVLWVEPVIRQLLPKYNLVFYTKFPQLFEGHPFKNLKVVSELSLWEKFLWKLDKISPLGKKFLDLEMAYERESRMHILHAYQQELGLPLTQDKPKIYSVSRPKEQTFGNYIVLHLETLSKKNYRNVYGIDWQVVTDFIRSQGLNIIQVGVKPADIPGATYMKTTIPELIGLLRNARLFIGIDSGPSHIASAVNLPSIIFFGSVNPEFRHFRKLFNGVFMQSYCEYQNCYHSTVNTNGVICRLVGDEGIPKCAIHNNEDLISNLQKLLQGDKKNN